MLYPLSYEGGHRPDRSTEAPVIESAGVVGGFAHAATRRRRHPVRPRRNARRLDRQRQRNWRRAGGRDRPAVRRHRAPDPRRPRRQVIPRSRRDASPERVEELVAFLLEGESTDTGDVVAMPGAIAALDLLPTNRWAIVTSGGLRLATARLRRLACRIRATWSLPTTSRSASLTRRRTWPARRCSGWTRRRCLVVEDAPAGVTSGRAAGAQVIGLRTTHPDLGEQEGIPTLASFEQVEFSADRLGVIVTY